MAVSDILRGILWGKGKGERKIEACQSGVLVRWNALGGGGGDKTKQNVAVKNGFQLCTAGSNLMHSIHNVKDNFFTTGK